MKLSRGSLLILTRISKLQSDCSLALRIHKIGAKGQLHKRRFFNLYNVAMSENFVTVAPGLTGLLADNGCILWNGTPHTDGYGYTKLKEKLVLQYRLALDADWGRCLQEGFSAGHHCDDLSIGLSSGQKNTNLAKKYRVSTRTIYKIDKGKTWQ